MTKIGKLLRQAESDLGLNVPYIKGQVITIKNCWHFSTDGNAVSELFRNEKDFIRGMNRVYVVVQGYNVIILAFSLMDTHVHFVLYGTFEDCNRFVHEYLRRTSMYIADEYGENKKLENLPVSHQTVDDDDYLKTVICYTVRNAPVGGIPFMGYDYLWGSGALYFRKAGYWTSPAWLLDGAMEETPRGKRALKKHLGTNSEQPAAPRMIGDLVFPGEYVAWKLVERLFKTCKSFNYFMSRCREDDVDSRGGKLSLLSIPMQEMRQNKNIVCRELFGVESVKTLNMEQRVRLARTLKARYNSSLKQICRLSGLIFEEVKDWL